MESTPPAGEPDEPGAASVLVLRAWIEGTPDQALLIRVTRVDDVQATEDQSSFVTAHPGEVLAAVEAWLAALADRRAPE